MIINNDHAQQTNINLHSQPIHFVHISGERDEWRLWTILFRGQYIHFRISFTRKRRKIYDWATSLKSRHFTRPSVPVPGAVHLGFLFTRWRRHRQSLPELVEGVVHVAHARPLPVTGRPLVVWRIQTGTVLRNDHSNQRFYGCVINSLQLIDRERHKWEEMKWPIC